MTERRVEDNMETGERAGQDPPFTPEQLLWIDEMVAARQSALATRRPPGDSSTPPLSTSPDTSSSSTTTVIPNPGEFSNVATSGERREDQVSYIGGSQCG